MQEYIPININTIKDGAIFDLYLKVLSEKETNFVLYKKANKKSKQKVNLNNTQPETTYIFIKKEDHKKYLYYLQKNLKDILIAHKADPHELCKTIYNILENVVDNLFRYRITKEALDNSKDIVNYSIDQILEKDISPYLVNLKIHNHIKYTQTVNCFILSIFFGKHLNYDKDDLKAIGIGALVHDIGETLLNPALTRIQRKFNPEERKMMEQHPYLGFKLLQSMNCLDPKSLFMVWEHHERWDGSGYPKKLREEEITIFGRMLGIVDVYAAMTTAKSYRKAFTPFEALKTMIASKQFNKYELDSFITFLSNSKIKIE